MFRLYHSNDLEVLKEILLSEMRKTPPGFFDKESILVQSQGMAHWLKLQIADGLGVSAQVDFPLPSSFIWKVFNQLKPDLPERSHFDKQAMAWRLMRLLPSLASQPKCEAIAHYLESDQDGLAKYQLAHQIADVFDQYLVYRPDWLMTWERGEDLIEGADIEQHPWQPVVWRALVEDCYKRDQSLDHRAKLTLAIDQLVQQADIEPGAFPKRIFVFGIAALPGSYWQVLKAISSFVEVHFFLLNPCRNFWGDIVSGRQRMRLIRDFPQTARYLEKGNPILASWGRLGKEFLTLVHETMEEGGLQDVDAYVELVNESSASQSAHNWPLLKQVQRDILELHDGQAEAYSPASVEHSRFKRSIQTTDDSLKLVSAHSPLREVQRLHDQLIYWFDHNPNIKPRDVVVMVPDIDLYATYIEAVFASAPPERRIPWSIADQSQVEENPLLDSVLDFLSLPDNRLELTQVLDWLAIPAIGRKFSINETDIRQLSDWLAQAEIKWGLDQAHRESFDLPGFDQNSWSKGLRQLLLGLVLPDSDHLHWQDDWPAYGVEGNQSELLGHLISFMDRIAHWQTLFSQPKATQEWLRLIPQLLDDLYEPDMQEAVQLESVRDSLSRWQDDMSDADFTGDMSFKVVHAWFYERLSQQGGWQRFLSGPVNFCTLMPMRSIPFKVVCLLGMNDQDYPRPVTPVGFDLMATGQARRGDRSRREDDRYLVLEALTSAQEHLYISYRGRDARENHPLQPSVLVSELQSYLSDAFCLKGDEALPAKQSRANLLGWLTEALPLQPFSSNAFEPEQAQAISSYHQLWAEVANAAHAPVANEPFFNQALSVPPEPFAQEILWADIKESILSPAKFFLKRRLKVNLNSYLEEESNEELFQLSALDSSILKTDQITSLLAGKLSLPEWLAREQALGHLPVAGLGLLAGEEVSKAVEDLVNQLGLYCQGQEQAFSCDLAVQPSWLPDDADACQLYAEVTSCWQNRLVQWHSGEVKGSHILNAWLDLVFISAAMPGTVNQARLLGFERKGKKSLLKEWLISAPDQASAQAYIQRCLEHYWRSWQGPQSHLPNLYWALNDSDDPVAIKKAIIQAVDNEFSEFNKREMQRCHPELANQLMVGLSAETHLEETEFASWKQGQAWLWSLLSEHIQAESLDSSGAAKQAPATAKEKAK